MKWWCDCWVWVCRFCSGWGGGAIVGFGFIGSIRDEVMAWLLGLGLQVLIGIRWWRYCWFWVCSFWSEWGGGVFVGIRFTRFQLALCILVGFGFASEMFMRTCEEGFDRISMRWWRFCSCWTCEEGFARVGWIRSNLWGRFCWSSLKVRTKGEGTKEFCTELESHKLEFHMD